MLLFTKFGALTPLSLLIGALLTIVLFNDPHTIHQWAIPLVLAGVVSLGVGFGVNRGRKARGQPRHHFMHVPMEYWGGVLLLGGAVVASLEPLGVW